MEPEKKTFNIDDILKSVPHSYPFLLFDQVIECKEGMCRGIKNVTINEPFFTGHFSVYPIMPGVLQIEAMAQVAGFSYAQMTAGEGIKKKSIPLLVGVDKAKFKKQVRPGDQLLITTRFLEKRLSLFMFSGQIHTRNLDNTETLVCSCMMKMVIHDVE